MKKSINKATFELQVPFPKGFKVQLVNGIPMANNKEVYYNTLETEEINRWRYEGSNRLVFNFKNRKDVRPYSREYINSL